MFHKHLNEPLELPSVRRGEHVPADLEAVVVRAMAKAPEQRYAHAGELVDALDACNEAAAWQPMRDVAEPATDVGGRQRTRRYGD
jgi:hypothetical protein